MDIIIPELLSGADMVGKLRHEERLANLGRSNEQIGPGVEQAVNDGWPTLVGRFI